MLVALIFCFFSVNAVENGGLDVTESLLGCIFSGGTCFDNTGIPILDSKIPERFSPEHMPAYYASQHYWDSNGAHECRTLKKTYLIKKHWPNYVDRGGANLRETMDIERQLNDLQRSGFIESSNCNEKQRQIFIKHKIKKG